MATARNGGAAAPGPVTPATSDEPRGLAGGAGSKGQAHQVSFDCATGERKELATLRAVAALAGASLHEMADGGFLLCRWGLSRELPDLRAVRELLRRMGVQA